MTICGLSITELTQIITIISSVVMVIISFMSVRLTSKTVKNQHRPYISFGIIRPKPDILSISIKNTGDRIAKNVQIESYPKIKSNTVSEQYIDDKLCYHSILPDYKYETAFDFISADGEAPTKYDIKISYSDDLQDYVENYIIDFSALKNSLSSETSSEKENSMASIVKELKKLNQILEKNV